MTRLYSLDTPAKGNLRVPDFLTLPLNRTCRDAVSLEYLYNLKTKAIVRAYYKMNAYSDNYLEQFGVLPYRLISVHF